jgi:hypothetical protein
VNEPDTGFSHSGGSGDSERMRNDAGSPTVMVMPDPGKPFEVFMADNSICR